MLDNSVSSQPVANTLTPDLPSKSDSKYDIIKFSLSLMVLAIHSSLYPMVLFPWLRIAVPIFFIISSKFIFAKLHRTPKETQLVILKKYFIRNLRLYACWLVILLPITLYIRKKEYFSAGFFENALTILKSILFGSTFVASWFIMATIIGVLLIYLLSKLVKKNYLIFLISLFAFCIVTLASSYSSVISGTFVSSAINNYISIFGGLVCSFPASILWVFIGKLFAERKIALKPVSLWTILVICSAVALFMEWKFVISLDGPYKNDSYFMLLPLCFLLFLGIEAIKPFYWKNSVYLRRASTIIYVTHGSLLPVISKIIFILFNVRIPILSFILTFLVCIAIYILLEIALNRFRKRKISKILKMLF